MKTTDYCQEQIKSLLSTQGYAVIPTGNIEGFKVVCNSLGKISQTSEIRITLGGTQYGCRHQAVPFHTDRPNVPIVAWHCETQDVNDGANLLVDSRKIVNGLSAVDKNTLTTVPLRMLHGTEFQPILSLSPYHIYWLPVVINEALESVNEAQSAAIDAFQKKLEEHETTGNVESVILQRGEALFVNNHMVLHGRRALSVHSERHLIRAFVT